MVYLLSILHEEISIMESKPRRTFLKKTVAGTVATIVATQATAQMSTPRDAEGPFYPITPQKDKDADLTKVEGKSGVAKGEIIEVFGQVLDTDLNPIEDVTIDLWQANTHGKYHHPHDTSEAPIDENFQSWAIIQSGEQGKFRVKTIKPGAYPLGAKPEEQRTPHIHLKVSKLGYDSLLTQMYFPGEKQNETDGLYQRKTAAQRKMMTAKHISGTNHYQYNIILEKV